ncbi:MAG: SDR family oxidoreductase [Sciscionella sp.]|nr:SDR family oxidoreductase [Sciscionella sp.]
MSENAKIALVTGANKGIGRETARGLARRNFTVLLGARNAELGEKTASELRSELRSELPADGDVRFLHIDVTDDNSIASAAEKVAAEFGRLDVLVNNAGIAERSTPSETKTSEMRRIYDTNVFGVVAVTNAFLPLLRNGNSARIVNMSSFLAALGMPAGGDREPPNLLAYNSSKTAVNAITVAFAKELANSGIKVNSACPGYCATDMNGHQGFRTPEQGARIAIELATIPDDGPTGSFFNEDGPLPW